MSRLSDNYYLRKYFLENNQVPTQTMMKEKMNPCLASVYFKSMSPKHKYLAGLEPPLKCAAQGWFIPPKELLQGRVVLKPIAKQFLHQLNWDGIDSIGIQLFRQHCSDLKDEKELRQFEHNIYWQETIVQARQHQWEDCAIKEARANTEAITKSFKEFTTLLRTSLTKLQAVLLDAIHKEINQVREETFKKMQVKYNCLLKQQAHLLYDKYEKDLMAEKVLLKEEFLEKLKVTSCNLTNKLHDINLDKHVAIEKYRQLLKCKKLACQVYVAMKERECFQDVEKNKLRCKKIEQSLNDTLALKDYEIFLAQRNEMKRQRVNTAWQNKVCHLVEKLQLFITYCLRTLPNYADFFINMEKLMLLQLNKAFDDELAESIFETNVKDDHTTKYTTLPEVSPFYLFCDTGYKADINRDLCPKRCTSSSSQLPVVIINKRCIYSACDNFKQFTDKVRNYLHRMRAEETDFEDDYDYSKAIPIKSTSSQRLHELKLESSLLQVLQQEIENIKKVSFKCAGCKIPYCCCFFGSRTPTPPELITNDQPISASPDKKYSNERIEREHKNEPKLESYCKYIQPKKCVCAKMAMKHLQENLPSYMLKTSCYGPPDLPNYETCSYSKLQELVKEANQTLLPPKYQSRTKLAMTNASTQYDDEQFNHLCNCFSNDDSSLFYDVTMAGSKMFCIPATDGHFKIVSESTSPTFLKEKQTSFAMNRAKSLLHLIGESLELKTLFSKAGVA